MSKEDRRKITESIAEKFTKLDENGKAFIAGYIAGKCEVKQGAEQEAEQEQAAPVA